MADPNSSFHYNNDPFSSPFITSDYIGLMNDSNPTLANDPAHSFNRFGDDLSNIPWDLFDDPMASFDDDLNRSSTDNETTQFQEAGRVEEDDGTGFLSDSIPVPFWPPEIAPFRCSCCQVLREIIHNDAAGKCATKLEIHGRMGIICHAILEIKDRVHMIEKSMDNVKQYLQQYCNDQQKGGLMLVNDPLSTYYEALCVGFDWDQNIDNNQQPNFPELGEQAMSGQGQAQAEGEEVREARSSLSQQRERAGKLTLEDLEDYFHLPLEEAAAALNLCPTVVKRICRRFGMTRWPHRKIKMYRRQISNLRTRLSSNHAEERSQAEAEIQRLEVEIVNLCTGGNYQLNYI